MAPVEAPPAPPAHRDETWQAVLPAQSWPPFEFEVDEPVGWDARAGSRLRRFPALLIRALLRLLDIVVRWVVAVLLGGTLVGTAVALLAYVLGPLAQHAVATSPAPRITFAPLATRSVVYAGDGTVLTAFHSEEDRVLVPIHEVPPHVVRAVLDAEDERFFEHGALDPRSILRAAASNLEAGRVVEGGSTITQQLAKIELLTSTKALDRKVKEAALAVRLEEQFTKTQILDRYLNKVYFGNGAYGLQAAAQRYYTVNVQDLTLGQGVLLAGLIRDPIRADPFTSPNASKERRAAVANRMQFLDHITPEQAEAVKGEPLPERPPDPPARSSDYFAELVKQELLRANWLGGSPEDRYRSVFEGGLSIHTTLDPRAQDIAQRSVDSIVPDDPRGFTASLVSVEPATGAVRALIGGPNFDETKFNLATDGDGRQVGSAFKMLTLLAAVESGFLPIDTISGAHPCPIDNRGGGEAVWSPANVEGQAAGDLTLGEATVRSVNCAYARLIKLVGPGNVVDIAHRMGITNELGPHLSLTLGSEPATPLQMAAAYATLAAGGVRQRPYFIESVTGRDGTMLYRHAAEPEQVVATEHTRIVTDVLTEVVSNGTATAAAIPGRPVAGKTGSTDENADAWFVGFTPQLSTAVWMGAPRARVSMYNVGGVPRVYGGTYPARIFGAYMGAALADQPALPFPGAAPPMRDPRPLTPP